jgi:hypothetical protein
VRLAQQGRSRDDMLHHVAEAKVAAERIAKIAATAIAKSEPSDPGRAIREVVNPSRGHGSW